MEKNYVNIKLENLKLLVELCRKIQEMNNGIDFLKRNPVADELKPIDK